MSGGGGDLMLLLIGFLRCLLSRQSGLFRGARELILLDSARLFLRQADAGFPKVRSALAHQELAPMR
jgi:hypothetical protein